MVDPACGMIRLVADILKLALAHCVNCEHLHFTNPNPLTEEQPFWKRDTRHKFIIIHPFLSFLWRWTISRRADQKLVVLSNKQNIESERKITDLFGTVLYAD